MKTRLLFALLLACAVATAVSAQVTFRAEVNYVEVHAVVTDAQGRIVTDLTQADFEVLEDGRPQKVSAFSLVNLPIERGVRPLFAGAPIEPDVQSNIAVDGRIYLIVLDDLHTSFPNTTRVKRFLRDFIERNFGVNDLAAVVYTSGRATAGQEFTNNPRLLLEAIDRFSGRRLRSEALELADSLNTTVRDPADERDLKLLDPLEMERAHNARTMLSGIRDLATYLEGVRGRRKAMLLISEGISYNVDDPFTNASAGVILQQTSDAIAAATRANMSVYAIDPRGLGGFEEAIEVGSTPSDVLPSQFNATRALLDAQRISQQSLQVLANETGGFAAVNQNDFAGAFERIVRENSTYYVLGYNPANDRRDGRFRRIDVRVTRPGLQVRSRRGYVAPRGRAPDTPRTAGNDPLDLPAATSLSSPIPLTGIPMTITAAAFKGAAPNASIAVAVEMRADAFVFAQKNGTFLDRVQVALSSLDSKGTVRPGQKHVLTMEMTPATAQAAREHGVRLVAEVALPPGKYQLRAGAAEEGRGLTGSGFFDLDIPDFHSAAFSMSGLVLTSAAAQLTPTVRASSVLGDVLPAPPASLREFGRNDQLALYAEFYENAPNAPPHALDLTATLRAEDGRVVFENREQRSSTDLQGKSGGYGYSLRFALKDVDPGLYVLRVEGRSRAGEERVAARELMIRVR
jgi:VWFA-related protein